MRAPLFLALFLLAGCQMTPEQQRAWQDQKDREYDQLFRATHPGCCEPTKPLTPEQNARAYERIRKQYQVLLNAPTRHWTVFVNDRQVDCVEMLLPGGIVDTRCN